MFDVCRRQSKVLVFQACRGILGGKSLALVLGVCVLGVCDGFGGMSCVCGNVVWLERDERKGARTMDFV